LPAGEMIFYPFTPSVPLSFLLSRYRCYLQRVKRKGHVLYHLLPSSNNIKNEGIYTSTPFYAFTFRIRKFLYQCRPTYVRNVRHFMVVTILMLVNGREQQLSPWLWSALQTYHRLVLLFSQQKVQTFIKANFCSLASPYNELWPVRDVRPFFRQQN
jgi:hypothetical protein